ncbi:strawberry notch-like NTP hydrolase domain-containing protein [Gluconobacter cerinus]
MAESIKKTRLVLTRRGPQDTRPGVSQPGVSRAAETGPAGNPAISATPPRPAVAQPPRLILPSRPAPVRSSALTLSRRPQGTSAPSVPAPSVRAPAASSSSVSPAGLAERVAEAAPSSRTGLASGTALDASLAVDGFGLPAVPVTPAVVATPEFVNDAQVAYTPLSQTSESEALLPAALHAPMTQALGRLREAVNGDVDGWLAEKLQWTDAQLKRFLACEQIDAVALAILNIEDGKGMLVGDVTGFGKGRILASVLRYAILSGRQAVFLTEKENLFSDIWRDIRDIESEEVVGRPFILNSGATILDMRTRRPVFPRWKPGEVTRIVGSGELPEGTRLVLSTYSQFNRKGAKADFLLSIAPGSSIFTDEVQNIANETAATSDIVMQAMRTAGSSTNASATSGRDVLNLRTYGTVFPWLSEMPELEDMSPQTRTWLAEASVQEAVRAGRLIRREQDMSSMNLEVLEDTANRERAIDVQNALAPLLSRLSDLNRMVEVLADERNQENDAILENLTGKAQKEAREKWSVANFGGRQAVVASQVMVSLMVDAAVREATDALLANEKPIIVLDSTMEAVMRALANGGPANGEGREGGGRETQAEEDDLAQKFESGPDDEAARPPGFRDIFRTLSEKILTVNVRRGNPLVLTQERLDPEQIPGMPALLEAIEDLIDVFPELPASPLDAIREGIEKRGRELHEAGAIPRPWHTGEISGRKMRVEGGRYARIPQEDLNRPMIVSQFNHDEGVDALLLTRSGSTGLSVHDSVTNAVAKRRYLIDVKTPDNPLERLQMYGRPRRRGQRSEPRFGCLTTGLPYHTYKLAVHNRKMMAMAASVSGSSQSAPGMDVPDFLNITGNEVARNMLRDNPALARRLHIYMGKEDAEAEKELYYVMGLFRRSPQLSYDEQKDVFDDFLAAYHKRVNEFGVRKVGMLDGQWHLQQASILEPGDSADLNGLDGGDVRLVSIGRLRPGLPVSRAQVAQRVSSAAETWPEVQTAVDWIAEHRLEILERRRGRLKGDIEALANDSRTSVSRTDREMRFARSVLLACRAGRAVRMVDAFGEEAEGVLTALRMPENLEDSAVFRHYELEYLIPGDDEPRHVTLDQMIRSEGRMTLLSREHTQRVMEAFHEEPTQGIAEHRHVLMGNMLRACLLSNRAQAGVKSQFRDTSGNLHDGILLTRREIEDICKADCRITGLSQAKKLLEKGVSLRTRGQFAEERLLMIASGPYVTLRMPKGAREKKTWMASPLAGALALSAETSEYRVWSSELPAVLQAVRDAGEPLYYAARDRDKAWTLEMEKRAISTLGGPAAEGGISPYPGADEADGVRRVAP